MFNYAAILYMIAVFSMGMQSDFKNQILYSVSSKTVVYVYYYWGLFIAIINIYILTLDAKAMANFILNKAFLIYFIYFMTLLFLIICVVYSLIQ